MTTNLAMTIDALGHARAQMAEWVKKEKELKAALGDLAPGAYEGDQFRLTISDSTRETLDMDAVREKLSRQFIAAHTNVTEVRTLRVVSRNGRGL